jgi:hypothetical protein
VSSVRDEDFIGPIESYSCHDSAQKPIGGTNLASNRVDYAGFVESCRLYNPHASITCVLQFRGKEEVVGSIPTMSTNLDHVHQSIERSRFKYPGLELRSRLFQNDSELPFVVETA